MARRRFAPLIAAVLVGAAVLVARLFQVQIVERDIWVDQAATLVRAGSVRPYQRGAILDREGRVLARDQTTYRAQLNYRDFRRAHPIGLVAHARSALLGRPVGLAEALERLPEWAEELVTLTPAMLDAFARGEALDHGSLSIAAIPGGEVELEDRGGRRSDVRYYALRLFELEREHTRALVRTMRERKDLTFVELVADVAARGDVAYVQERLRARLLGCSEDLERLALQLDADEREHGAQAAEGASLDRWIARLESWRVEVEDDSAGELFRDAAGFAAGRFAPELVERTFDLRWLESLMRWDAARTAQWLERSRFEWLESLRRGQVERWIAELELGERQGPLPQRVLARWKAPFAGRRDGDEIGSLAGFDQLEELFGVSLEHDPDAPPVLPFLDERALTADLEGPDDWRVLARAELGLDAPAEAIASLASAWQQAFADGFDARFVRERSLATLARWEDAFQAALASELERCVAEAGSSATGKLAFAAARLDRAGERARYVLKDRGSRALEVARQPSYATVHLLTRHPERFAGVRVVEAHDRVQTRDAEGRAIAGGLIGDVAVPTWRDQLIERDLRREFESLRRKGARSRDEQRDLEWLAPRVARADEERGRGGIESYCDLELAGRNGYSEQRGLQDVIDGRAELDIEPQDGSDVVLTLDLDLQRAARECLASPEADPELANRDDAWLASPTGAIVLLTPRGDVLAAASFPDFPRGEAEQRASRDQPFERTLRKPTFQPPGSVFKPFVAAWALDHVVFDPLHPETCQLVPELGCAGYLDVRCNSQMGHGFAVDLRDALKRSCNSYFARLGERLTQDDWRGLAAEFGFGRQTGIRTFGARRGLAEDTLPKLFERELKGRDLRLAGNGLAVVEATPMQVARAFAALATGELSDVRLIDRVAASEVERRSHALSLSAAALTFVRKSMEACANEAGGSAQPALNEGELGYRMAAKTGSGDIGERRVQMDDGKERVRKHTWVAGWLPAEDPQLVVVVFVHDTLQTASHGAIWIARALLRRPEVQAYLKEATAQ